MRFPNRKKFPLPLLISAVVLVCAMVYAEGQDPSEEPISKVDRLFNELMIEKLEKQAQPFDGTVWDLSGTKSALKDFKGKVTLVTFWATWCPPCRLEMPALQNLHETYKDKGLTILAVNLEESHAQVTEYFRRNKLTFKSLLDPSGELGRSLRLRAIPATYILDAEGFAIGFAVGPRPWDSPKAKTLVELLLGIE